MSLRLRWNPWRVITWLVILGAPVAGVLSACGLIYCANRWGLPESSTGNYWDMVLAAFAGIGYVAWALAHFPLATAWLAFVQSVIERRF